jgi:hypothetical protein
LVKANIGVPFNFTFAWVRNAKFICAELVWIPPLINIMLEVKILLDTFYLTSTDTFVDVDNCNMFTNSIY